MYSKCVCSYKVSQPLQNDGKNKIKTANNSNLPSNIPNDNIHLETSGKEEKFPLGPIIEPSPGPTLDIDVAAPEIDVIKSRPVRESNAVIIKKITMNILTKIQL